MCMSVEILAPAGGMQQLTAAVRSGADAVYLGTKAFNARRNASNFDGEALREAVAYCRGRGVKVYVTVNTLVKDSEHEALCGEIETLADCGIDAVLVQDLATAEMFRVCCPSIPLHASTQMAIHSLEGVLAAEDLGFKRVVLARELSIEEIAKICRGCSIETEVFVHGALCMSVSGECFLSSILGGRSGNRGLCAQPCRLDFRAGDRQYTLSLKDMSHISHIARLADAGVSSLKIEGRMKRPEYVAAAVAACREAVSGGKADLTNLRAVFSRGGFTDGYLTGRRDLTMFGRRTEEDVKASAAVLGDISSGYRNELSRIPVDMKLTIRENANSCLEVTDGSSGIKIYGDVPERANVRGTSREDVFKSLSKTGGTPFLPGRLAADLDPTLILAQSKINSMRKEALEKLLEKRSEIIPKTVTGPYIPPVVGKHEVDTKLRVRLQSGKQLYEGIDAADKIYMPLREINGALISEFGDKLICELPRLTFPLKEQALETALVNLRDSGLKRVCAENIGALRLARRLGFITHGGFGLNIINSLSLMKYKSLGLEDAILSFEINLADAADLGGDSQRGIISYGYLPLMIFRNCPAKGKNGCFNCGGTAEISDRRGARFKIVCADREYSVMHNRVPLYLGDKTINGMDFRVLYYTFESAGDCRKIYNDHLSGKPYEGEYTRGLYYRKLL